MGKMRKSIFVCPVCSQPLERDEHSCRCSNGHVFDVSKEGYVNLLPANRRHSDMPGDDRTMVNARTCFLSGGWYAPLRDELCRQVERTAGENEILLDAGCGEGYYTEALCSVMHRCGGTAAGIDLSKAAVKRAAKRCPEAEIAVASVYHMPLAEQSVSMLVNCFAPLAAEEFCRVLKPGGVFLYIVPGRKHLWEMKEILYDQPYENEHRDEVYAGFHQTDQVPLEFQFRLRQQDEIAALFQMTPYAWKTPKQGIERLQQCQELKMTAQFRILVYKKE